MKTTTTTMEKLLVPLTLLSLYGLQGLLAASGCGKPLISTRIVGGSDAAVGKWPWQVLIYNEDSDDCGGSLLSNSWVLSAAHCFGDPGTLSGRTIYLGMNKMSDRGNPRTVSRGMKQVIIHPAYTGEGASGDIALVLMDSPVDFTPLILPICLPSPSLDLPEGTLCWATGWGNVYFGVPLAEPKILQEVELALINFKDCEAMYREGLAPGFKLVHEDLMCAGYVEGKKDACQGDSGGPLTCNVNGVWVQLGVISWGIGCAEPNHPGIYTRVSKYLSWIEEYVMPTKKNDDPQKSPQIYRVNIPNHYYRERNNSRNLLKQNDSDSRNLRNKVARLVADNGGPSHPCSMANAMMVLFLGLVLLL